MWTKFVSEDQPDKRERLKRRHDRTELSAAKLSAGNASCTFQTDGGSGPSGCHAVVPVHVTSLPHRGSTSGDNQIKHLRINSVSTRSSSGSAHLNPPNQTTQPKVQSCASNRCTSLVIATETNVSPAPPVGPEGKRQTGKNNKYIFQILVQTYVSLYSMLYSLGPLYILY